MIQRGNHLEKKPKIDPKTCPLKHSPGPAALALYQTCKVGSQGAVVYPTGPHPWRGLSHRCGDRKDGALGLGQAESKHAYLHTAEGALSTSDLPEPRLPSVQMGTDGPDNPGLLTCTRGWSPGPGLEVRPARSESCSVPPFTRHISWGNCAACPSLTFPFRTRPTFPHCCGSEDKGQKTGTHRVVVSFLPASPA